MRNVFLTFAKESYLLLQNINIANEAACRVASMDASHWKLSEKYEAPKEALEKEKQGKLRLQVPS